MPYAATVCRASRFFKINRFILSWTRNGDSCPRAQGAMTYGIAKCSYLYTVPLPSLPPLNLHLNILLMLLSLFTLSSPSLKFSPPPRRRPPPPLSPLSPLSPLPPLPLLILHSSHPPEYLYIVMLYIDTYHGPADPFGRSLVEKDDICLDMRLVLHF